MNRTKPTGEEKLYIWCLEQASARFMGTLSQDKIDKLDSLDFPWDYYERELDKLGFDWKKNSKEDSDYVDKAMRQLKEHINLVGKQYNKKDK